MTALPLRTPWRGGVLAVVIFLTPWMAWLGPLGFPALVAAAGLLLLPAWLRRPTAWPGALLLAGLLLWAVGSLGWSPAAPKTIADYADLESLTALKLALQLACYSLFAAAAAGLSGAAASRALRILAWGMIGLAVVLVVEGLSGAAVYQWMKRTFEDPIRADLAVRNVGQGSVILALLFWPALPWLRGPRTWGVYVIAIALVLAPFVLGQMSALAALIAGTVAWAAVRGLGRRGAWAIGALLALQVLATPWLVNAAAAGGGLEALKSALPASWEARLDIWAYAGGRVAQHPLIGWGLDASRRFGLAVPLHPHNGAMQVWLELGAVGAALLALLWAALFGSIGRIAREDRGGAAACAGAAGAYFTIGALSFGIWQEWWLALAALTAAACAVMLTWRRHERLADPPAELHADGLAPL